MNIGLNFVLGVLGGEGVLGILNLPAQVMRPYDFSMHSLKAWIWILMAIILITGLAVFWIAIGLRNEIMDSQKQYRKSLLADKLEEYTDRLDRPQLQKLLQLKSKSTHGKGVGMLLLLSAILYPAQAYAQETGTSIWAQGGIILTLILLLIPVLAGLVLVVIQLKKSLNRHKRLLKKEEATLLANYLSRLPEEKIEALRLREEKLSFSLSHQELAGTESADDKRGLLTVNSEQGFRVVAIKKKALPRPPIDPQLKNLVLGYLICATGWLLFGTTVGEYVGIKFVAPDIDQVSWLSFGRLRPVHTNSVFWGWASLGMLGLGYYIVPRVSNVKLASVRWGWISLVLINLAVILGTISLMAGLNNGGGEYREYVWPIMLLFAIGLVLTLVNFVRTIAQRNTREIYISNWYMVAAIIFTIVITLVAYLPFWQKGLGETIVQGYYMHQGVGMWFMLFTLGIVYYFLPQQLNKPIYSYSLGILAFWTQILFYTLIGTHHFVFSAIPWWLQTVAIVGSMGMVIPVVAGTTNFLMTFRGAWYKIQDSYTLPFFLVGIIFYFTGSLQGTAEAFRFTNLIWHFTDFTVAHSHLTMYGIISFFLWAATYAVVPRLTGKEPPQITVGAHFWMALLGLMFYSVPLMYGGTLRGLSWLEGKPFIESVSMMMPFWLWRAIGGSLMWVSHLFFAYNMYRMIKGDEGLDVKAMALEKLGEMQPVK